MSDSVCIISQSVTCAKTWIQIRKAVGRQTLKSDQENLESSFVIWLDLEIWMHTSALEKKDERAEESGKEAISEKLRTGYECSATFVPASQCFSGHRTTIDAPHLQLC
jgi:hypothetical protein